MSGNEEPGAESRSADPAAAWRAIGAEHLRLEELIGDIEVALARNEPNLRTSALAQDLQNAMLAHFEREESLYYPTLWALRPELEGNLKALLDVHPDFRARLAVLVETLEHGEIERAGRLLDEFSALFGDHEHAEERILASLLPDGSAAQSDV